MRRALPVEPHAKRLLENWDSTYRERFRVLVMRFGKLHLAINAQRPEPRWSPLKLALDAWEDVMLDTFLDLDADIIPRLRDGYGNEQTFALYQGAIDKLPEHEANYDSLREQFSQFLDK